MEHQPNSHQQHQPVYEEEISLYDIIQKLLAHKWFILVCTLVALMLSITYVTFFQEPSYEAQGSVTISQQPTSLGTLAVDSQGNAIMAKPQASWSSISTDAAMQEMLSEPVLQDVIDSLQLNIRAHQLAAQIQVNAPSRTHLVTASHSSSDPELSKNIVNSLLQAYQAYAHDRITREIQQRISYIETSLEEASQQFLDIQDPYYETLHALDMLTERYLSQTEMLRLLATDLHLAECQIHTIEMQLNHLHQQIEDIPQTAEVSQEQFMSSPSDSPTQHISYFTSDSQSQTETGVLPNNLHIELQSTIHNLDLERVNQESTASYISLTMEELQKNVVDTLTQIKLLEAQEDKLSSDLEQSRRNRSTYQYLLNEANMELASFQLSPPISISSLASLPTEDTSNKKLIIAVAVLLGIFLSVLIVFVKDAYLEEKRRKSSQADA